MQGLTLFNLNLTHLLDAFLETAVPMIAGLAEVVGLFIIIKSGQGHLLLCPRHLLQRPPGLPP